MKTLLEKLIALSREKKFVAKAISLILALILWGYLNDSKTGKMKFEAAIEFKNLPQGYCISSVSEKIITVTMEGKKEYLKGIDVESIAPFINLENPKIDENWPYQIQINRQQIPDRIAITLSVDKTRITVERRIQKRVKIMPVITGELKKGYIAGRIKTFPDNVDITGAKSLVEKINHVSTEPIALNENQGDISCDIDLIAPSQEVELSEIKAKVSVSIMKMDDLYSVEVPVLTRNSSHEYRHTLANEKIRVYLRKGDRMIVSPSDIDISINAGPIEKHMKEKKIKTLDSDIPVPIIFKFQNNEPELINYSPDIIKVRSESLME